MIKYLADIFTVKIASLMSVFNTTVWVRCLLLLWVMVGSILAQASINTFEFETPAQRQQFLDTIAELRCPKCQNQSISDSDAMIAQDIKKKVYDMFQAGHSQADILEFMIERYGDFVTYRPPVRRNTWILWFGPPVLVLSILGLLFFRVVRKNRRTTLSSSTNMSVNEQDFENLLKRYEDQS